MEAKTCLSPALILCHGGMSFYFFNALFKELETHLRLKFQKAQTGSTSFEGRPKGSQQGQGQVCERTWARREASGRGKCDLPGTGRGWGCSA